MLKFKNKLQTMPASAAKQNQKQTKKIQKLKFVLIQSDKISVIFLYLQAQLQLFKIIKLCSSAQAIEKFFGSFRFCNFTMLQKQEKRLHLSKQSNRN